MDENKEKKENVNDFPNKRDFWYTFSILVLVITGLTAFYFGGEGSNMVSHVGFAGTIVSILLAVIAIIYSFYQSSTYENATHKLDTSAQKIENATNQLSNVSEIEKMMDDFKVDVTTIKKSIDDMQGMLGKVDNGFSSLNRNIEELYNDGQTESYKNENNLAVTFDENYFRVFLKKTSKLTFYVFLLIAKSRGVSEEIDMERWLTYFWEGILENTPHDDIIHHSLTREMGQLMAFSQVGFFDLEITYEDATIKVSNIVNSLIEAILEEEKEILKGDGKDKLKKIIKNLDKDINKE
ncbi:hypothetical protein [Bacillus sp. es.036]|uniref:hypothetical protein n=1 Tax=Bacillus sp. es.036 TaxID=1761764 RepID=UPI000BF3C282|nr:hypothetical protein [Bacillus sp. es.036]PFG03037.1 hypothetical protein ATG70_4266 [Bacillus sp. es.036]